MFKKKEKQDDILISISKSNSTFSEKFGKKRLIIDYSRSTFNLANDLNVTDEFQVQEIFKNEPGKKNALNIGKLLNIKNNKNKLNKNKTNINELNNNKKYNSNSSLEKNRRKKVDINDYNEYNIYYNLDSKKKENKFKFLSGNMTNNLKRLIFKYKTKNPLTKKNIPLKNKKVTKNLNYQKSENIFCYENLDNKKKAKNNQVFKNVLNSKNNNIKSKNHIFNKEKIRSNITLNIETSLTNNSIIGINSLLNNKIKSLDNTNSRNFNYIQYNTNPNLNLNQLKTDENTKMNLTKKLLNKDKKCLRKNTFYNINENQKIKDRNKRPVAIKKNESKLMKEKSKYYVSKIKKNVKKNNDLKINLFQNKIIKKKESNKQINNTKKFIHILINKKAQDNLSDKKFYRKIPIFIKELKTSNPSENDNFNKIEKNSRKTIPLENLYYTQSNISHNSK